MCTAVSYNGNKSHYFGRNLDLEVAFQEQVAVTPRNYPFKYRCGLQIEEHYSMIGMATMCEGYPLYYEATNECGLSMAGLNFPGIATYLPKCAEKDNIAPFELIPWILGQCSNVTEAKDMLLRLNVWNMPFSRALPLSPLHWIIADREDSIVAEPMADGLQIHDDPFGVVTNNPPFPYHLYHLADYMELSSEQAQNRFCEKEIKPYSNGMGAMGLPGDYSSASRFIRAAFVKENSPVDGDDVSQFFHILSSVAMPRGSILMPNGKHEITLYSCCCDTKNGIYYYTTYDNSRITAVNMRNCPLGSCQVITYPLQKAQDIRWEN